MSLHLRSALILLMFVATTPLSCTLATMAPTGVTIEDVSFHTCNDIFAGFDLTVRVVNPHETPVIVDALTVTSMTHIVAGDVAINPPVAVEAGGEGVVVVSVIDCDIVGFAVDPSVAEEATQVSVEVHYIRDGKRMTGHTTSVRLAAVAAYDNCEADFGEPGSGCR